MGISAQNMQNMNMFFNALNGIKSPVTNPNQNQTDVFSKIRELDLKDGKIDGFSNAQSIFSSNNQNNSELLKSYLEANNANSQEAQAKKDKFIQDFLLADAGDGNFDGSVINPDLAEKEDIKNTGVQSLSLSTVLKIAQNFDAADDQKVNGSIFKNEALLQYLDLADDGIKNKSAQNFLKEEINIEIVDENTDPESTTSATEKDDSKLINGYNMFNPFNDDTSLFDEQVEDILFKNNGESIVYNPHQYKESQSPADSSINMANIKGKETLVKAIKIGLGELGVNESNGQQTKYGLNASQPWCAAFATWSIMQAAGGNIFIGANGKPVNRFSCSSLVNWASGNNQQGKNIYTTKMSEAKVGDAIIFRDPKTGHNSTHIGIITKIENGKIYTIEGNTSNKVAERTYDIGNARLQGIIKLNEYVA